MDKIKEIKGLVKEGNTCLFTLFIFFNLFTFLTSLGIVGIAIYLFVITKQANGFNIGFLVVGAVLLIFSAMAFKMRRSIHLMGLYLVILTIIFLVEMIATILLIVVPESTILEWAAKHADTGKTQEVIA